MDPSGQGTWARAWWAQVQREELETRRKPHWGAGSVPSSGDLGTGRQLQYTDPQALAPVPQSQATAAVWAWRQAALQREGVSQQQDGRVSWELGVGLLWEGDRMPDTRWLLDGGDGQLVLLWELWGQVGGTEEGSWWGANLAPQTLPRLGWGWVAFPQLCYCL